jgi:hypothetical protein
MCCQCDTLVGRIRAYCSNHVSKATGLSGTNRFTRLSHLRLMKRTAILIHTFTPLYRGYRFADGPKTDCGECPEEDGGNTASNLTFQRHTALSSRSGLRRVAGRDPNNFLQITKILRPDAEFLRYTGPVDCSTIHDDELPSTLGRMNRLQVALKVIGSNQYSVKVVVIDSKWLQ